MPAAGGSRMPGFRGLCDTPERLLVGLAAFVYENRMVGERDALDEGYRKLSSLMSFNSFGGVARNEHGLPLGRASSNNPWRKSRIRPGRDSISSGTVKAHGDG